MNLLDLAILVFLGFFLYTGRKKGLIRETFGLIAVLGALILAVVYMDTGVLLLIDLADVPLAVALAISFLLIFIVVFITIRIIGAVLSKLIRLTLLGWLDRLGGLFFGFVKGLLFASLILLGLTLLSWPRNIESYIDYSTLGPSVQTVAPRMFNRVKFLTPAAKSIYQEFLESLSDSGTVNPGELKEKALKRILGILEGAG
ncbi:MAG: CvpA family protein [Gemmatimonadota bacterium]|nr:MAG: CvpA family protein [Gemmatimonadota bacterium]